MVTLSIRDVLYVVTVEPYHDNSKIVIVTETLGTAVKAFQEVDTDGDRNAPALWRTVLDGAVDLIVSDELSGAEFRSIDEMLGEDGSGDDDE